LAIVVKIAIFIFGAINLLHNKWLMLLPAAAGTAQTTERSPIIAKRYYKSRLGSIALILPHESPISGI